MEAWQAYCDASPPLQVMVQAYLNFKPIKRSTGGDLGELLQTLQAFPGAAPMDPERPVEVNQGPSPATPQP